MSNPFDEMFQLPGAAGRTAAREAPPEPIAAPEPANRAPPSRASGPNRDVYSVGRLNNEVGRLLEDRFPMIWVEGELSNLSTPSSGHMYFTLKEEGAQVRCALFRGNRAQLDFAPENGMQVLVRARVGLYGPRGDFQLIIQDMEPAGDGALRLAWERLRRRLQEEGLFAAEDKRPLPAFPRRLGVVTSPAAAALKDVLKVLEQRFPSLPVRVYPVRVQGEGAGAEIAWAIGEAGRQAACDTLLVVRGGGSLEDLWAFNEEAVVRAIRACPIPVVTGIGHESDVSLADFAADVHAPTPSVAAARASPDGRELGDRLANLARRTRRAGEAAVGTRRAELALHRKRLRHPRRQLENMTQRTDELWRRLDQGLRRNRGELGERLVALVHRARRAGGAAIGTRRAELALHRKRLRHPRRQLENMGRLRTRLEYLRTRGGAAMARRFQHARERLAAVERTCHAVSPESTLERGYAIVFRDGKVVRDADEIKAGASITARLAKGELDATVTSSRRRSD